MNHLKRVYHIVQPFARKKIINETSELSKNLQALRKNDKKAMVDITGQQIIKMHILPSIPRSNDNQAMKFGQLIKYSLRNFFFKNRARMRQRD